MLEKLTLFHLSGLIILVLLIDRSALHEKLSFKMLDLSFYMISIAATVSKKIEALIRSMRFLSFKVALYLYR